MHPYPEPTVSAVIFNPDNKILLCKSHKWEDKWIIPGGHIERGEPMEKALLREIREETNLDIHDIKLLGIQEYIQDALPHGEKHYIFIDYTCRTETSDVILNDEAEEYAWVDLREIQNYPLGGFTDSLLKRLVPGNTESGGIRIFYNYA